MIETVHGRAVARRLAPYTFLDYATQGYLLLVALLVVCFHGDNVPYWPRLVLAHGGLAALLHWLIQQHHRPAPGRVIDFLRHFYPVLLFAGWYRETAELNHMFFRGYLDPWLIRAEGELFGGRPSLDFMAAWPSTAASELFYAAYFSYYVMIAGVGLALFLRNRRQFQHYLSVVSFLFYACYLCYIVLPVVGPRILYGECPGYRLPEDLQPMDIPAYPSAVQSALFYKIMALIYQGFAARGAAFPSSHVAVAIATCYFSFLYLKPIRVLHLLAVFLLCAATVYCRYHYLLDVIAGIATAGLLIPAGNWLFFRFTTPEASGSGRTP